MTLSGNADQWWLNDVLYIGVSMTNQILAVTDLLTYNAIFGCNWVNHKQNLLTTIWHWLNVGYHNYI